MIQQRNGRGRARLIALVILGGLTAIAPSAGARRGDRGLRTPATITVSAPVEAPSSEGIKMREHEVERGGVKLVMLEKWLPGEESKWKSNGKVVLHVHGATWSSHCTFDPLEGYSLMDALAQAGFDVFAIDLHGYGRSGKTERDWTESPSASDDLDAAADYIGALRWVEKIHLFGYQWGSQPAGIFAMKKPHKVARLALFGMRYSVAERIAAPQVQYRLNSISNATLNSDEGDLDSDFVSRRASTCLQYDPRSPNGALRDLARQSFVDPARLKVPTLLIQGDKDTDAAAMQDRLDFFKALAAHTREFVVLGGLGKYATFERGRGKFEQALINFFEGQ